MQHDDLMPVCDLVYGPGVRCEWSMISDHMELRTYVSDSRLSCVLERRRRPKMTPFMIICFDVAVSIRTNVCALISRPQR